MGKRIHLIINLTDDSQLTGVTFDYNDSKFPSDFDTLRKLSYTLYKACNDHRDHLLIQDLMADINNPTDGDPDRDA